MNQMSRRDDQDNERRFNISQSLPEVSSLDKEQLLVDLRNFEKKLESANIRSHRDMLRVWTLGLKGPALQWIELEKNSSADMQNAYWRTRSPNASDADYLHYWRLCRAVLMRRAACATN